MCVIRSTAAARYAVAESYSTGGAALYRFSSTQRARMSPRVAPKRNDIAAFTSDRHRSAIPLPRTVHRGTRHPVRWHAGCGSGRVQFAVVYVAIFKRQHIVVRNRRATAHCGPPRAPSRRRFSDRCRDRSAEQYASSHYLRASRTDRSATGSLTPFAGNQLQRSRRKFDCGDPRSFRYVSAAKPPWPTRSSGPGALTRAPTVRTPGPES